MICSVDAPCLAVAKHSLSFWVSPPTSKVEESTGNWSLDAIACYFNTRIQFRSGARNQKMFSLSKKSEGRRVISSRCGVVRIWSSWVRDLLVSNTLSNFEDEVLSSLVKFFVQFFSFCPRLGFLSADFMCGCVGRNHPYLFGVVIAEKAPFFYSAQCFFWMISRR